MKKSDFKFIVLVICIISFAIIKFYSGELPISDRDACATWIGTIGLITFFLM
jgi:hypothetical protein